ncbi:phosphatidylglycerophosphatase A [Veillonella denticariosi JCM 15641]|uniref:Phosphatidylglycerophosphatase A n=1 Tax=Veillonella denticariosi JCM 15641 TaxID=1298594 RepID=A0A2S7ZAH4_9FIRM|nr:phosphatidylglycerophosphatase A [Veillonella denticariosi]PQL20288.1 phosphatidylglycerophosphatase A [Veillonella denticariosi JCM 15641]
MESTKDLEKYTYELLAERGVTLEDIAELVLYVQKPYMPNLSIDECRDSVASVLAKREVHNAILTGVELDKLAEQNKLSQPLQHIVTHDESLYGIDEILAFSIVNLYGSIGFTNYGYLDKVKPGIIKDLDSEVGGRCNTFLDDLVGAVAAAAAGRIAHNEPHRVQHALADE